MTYWLITDWLIIDRLIKRKLNIQDNTHQVTDWLTEWLNDKKINWLTNCSFDRQFEINCHKDWSLTSWLTGWLIQLLIYWKKTQYMYIKYSGGIEICILQAEIETLQQKRGILEQESQNQLDRILELQNQQVFFWLF